MLISDPDDSVLVRAARAGDRYDFGRLLERHRPHVLTLYRRVLRDPHLAEDAVQEAAVRALGNLDRLRDARQFGAWLAGIGLNVVRHWLRDQRHEAWSWDDKVGDADVVVFAATSPDPADLMEERELVDRVRAAVLDLPAGQRSAVLLFYLSGLKQAETAGVLGIDVSAVKTHLHNARRALRSPLQAVWEAHTMTAPTPTKPIALRVVDVWRLPAANDRPVRFHVRLAEVGGTRGFPSSPRRGGRTVARPSCGLPPSISAARWC